MYRIILSNARLVGRSDKLPSGIVAGARFTTASWTDSSNGGYRQNKSEPPYHVHRSNGYVGKESQDAPPRYGRQTRGPHTGMTPQPPQSMPKWLPRSYTKDPDISRNLGKTPLQPGLVPQGEVAMQRMIEMVWHRVTSWAHEFHHAKSALTNQRISRFYLQEVRPKVTHAQMRAWIDAYIDTSGAIIDDCRECIVMVIEVRTYLSAMRAANRLTKLGDLRGGAGLPAQETRLLKPTWIPLGGLIENFRMKKKKQIRREDNLPRALRLWQEKEPGVLLAVEVETKQQWRFWQLPAEDPRFAWYARAVSLALWAERIRIEERLGSHFRVQAHLEKNLLRAFNKATAEGRLKGEHALMRLNDIKFANAADRFHTRYGQRERRRLLKAMQHGTTA